MTDTTGFVGYGSGDTSIILETPLTSQASVLTPTIGVAGTEKTAASIIYDSELGITYVDGSNAVVSFVDSSLNVMKYGYQISFEIETKFIAEVFTSSGGVVCGSDGIEHEAVDSNFAAYALTDAAGSNVIGKAFPFRQSTTNSWWMRALSQFTSGTPSRGIQSIGKDRFCLFTVSVVGDKIDFYIDKGLIGTASNAHLGVDVGRLFIGNDRGNTNRGLRDGYHIRNLVVSTRPVGVPVLPVTRKFVWLGDSFTSNAGVAYGSPLFDAKCEITLQRKFHDLGIGIGEQDFYFVSGGTWWNDGTTIQAELSNAVAADGDVYILYGGWNDCALNSGASLNAGTEAGLKLAIDDIIANTRASAIVIVNQTAFQGLSTHTGADYNGNVGRFNTMLKTLPAYAETVEAGWGAKTFISDAFSACGGNNMPADYTKGGMSGAEDDQHPSAKQSSIVGPTAASTIINNVLK